jgi:hypothetical protein
MKKPKHTLDNLPYDETVVAVVESFRKQTGYCRRILRDYTVSMRRVSDLRGIADEMARAAGTRLRDAVTSKWSAQEISDAISKIT